MDPNIITLCMDILKNNVVPFGMGMVKTKIDQRFEKDIMQKEIDVDNKKMMYLDKQEKGLSVPTVNDELTISDFDDLDEFHQAKWVQYFGTLSDLPENADTPEVKAVMNEILSDIRVYPCESCRANAGAHLSALDQKGKSFTDVETKKEAIQRLCEFKNEINEMKGNAQYNCELVINNGYQAKKL